MSRDLLVVVCAISAGVHAALAPEHTAFLPAAAILAALAAAISRSARAELVDGAIVVLGGLIGAYALATTTGLPLLHPDPEPVTGLGLTTKAFEAVGLLAALHLKGALSWQPGTHTVRFLSR